MHLVSLIKNRMLDKDPKKRINIDDVDKEIRNINFKRIYNGKNTKTGSWIHLFLLNSL
jgi:hypothetical protein